MDGLEVEVDIRLVRDGEVILDGRLAELLKAVSRTGSLLAAAKLIGIPYSRAWRSITSMERKLGRSIIAPRRGGKYGGGTTLTEEGEKLLSAYEKAEKELGVVRKSVERAFERPDLLIVGSHDLLLERAVGRLRGRKVEVHWIGSYGGLLSMMMGDADISGIHLLDAASGKYNEPIVRRLFPAGGVSLLRGYDREIGWAMRRGTEFDQKDLLEGKVILANRNRGSGTRLLLDSILSRLAEEMGIEPKELRDKVRGYNKEFFTHTDACRAIAEGRADITLTIRPVAEIYGLKFVPIGWERYDLVVSERVKEDLLESLLDAIRAERPPAGYRVGDDLGRRIL